MGLGLRVLHGLGTTKLDMTGRFWFQAGFEMAFSMSPGGVWLVHATFLPLVSWE